MTSGKLHSIHKNYYFIKSLAYKRSISQDLNKILIAHKASTAINTTNKVQSFHISITNPNANPIAGGCSKSNKAINNIVVPADKALAKQREQVSDNIKSLLKSGLTKCQPIPLIIAMI